MTTTDPHDDHLTPEQALDLAHGLLGAEGALERVRLLGHAGACAPCAAALAAAEAEGRLLRQRLAPVPAPAGLEGRVVDRVRARAWSRAWARRALLVASAAAAVAAAATGAAFRLRPPDRHEVLVQAIETSEARALQALLEEAAK